MAYRRHGTDWFAALRRDGRLFSVLAGLILLLHALQPWAEARASATQGGFVICTALGMVQVDDGNAGHPSSTPDHCPGCLGSGAHCGTSVQPKLALLPFPAFSLPDAQLVAPASPARLERLPSIQGDPPPAIRAPPFSL